MCITQVRHKWGFFFLKLFYWNQDNAIVHVRRGLVICKVTSSQRKTCNYRFQLTRTWKMPYEINNNIFHGANKLQEKNTWAFSNRTLQIKSLMKSAPAKHFQRAFSNRTLQIKSLMKSAPTKHFQNLVRCNSYLGPLITSPPQITVFTLYVIHVNWNL
jgi:hypothetical protein